MKTLPYTIRIFVPDGDPKGLRIIDKMNWTGAGLIFPRDNIAEVVKRAEFSKAGIYILAGLPDDDEDPRTIIYIGQTDNLEKRLLEHDKRKDFWSWACVFLSTNDGLNRAHITWIEHKLIQLASKYEQAILKNRNDPAEPTLTEAEKADTRSFLHEMLQVMPLVGLHAFEAPKIYQPKDASPTTKAHVLDTIIVPAKEDGFQKVFLGENCWYAVRIGGGALKNIKYIAAYRSHPTSAVTHYAAVKKIIPYGDTGKYKLLFAEAARATTKEIPFDDLPAGGMQSIRYTSFAKLQSAQKMRDLF